MRTIALDSQILTGIQNCGRKTKFDFIDHWRPTTKAEALEKGDLLHKMFAYYYRGKRDGLTKDDMSHATLIAGAIAQGREAAREMEIGVLTVEEIISVFKQNILHWQRDGWKVLEVEQSFSKLLFERPDEPGREGLRILYEGIIDLVVEHPQPHGIYIVDHKSQSRKWDPFKLSNQFMGYCWALEMNQIIINNVGFQKTLPNDQRFTRKHVSYERDLIREWVQQAIYWTHVLVGYMDQGFFPPNFTSCEKYSGCIYQQVCTTIPQVRDFKLESFYHKGEPWSPHTRDAKEAKESGEEV